MNEALPQTNCDLSGGEFHEPVRPRVRDESTGLWREALHWHAIIRFECPHCSRRHRAYLRGSGELPPLFRARCNRTQQLLLARPWHMVGSLQAA